MILSLDRIASVMMKDPMAMAPSRRRHTGGIALKRSCLLYCTQEPTKSKATKNRFISNWFKQLDIKSIEMGFFKQWI
jgi:hypothetical protein